MKKEISIFDIYGGIFGLAVGDAMGVPFEFRSRDEMREKPVTKMVGGGTHGQYAGYWSDDTSMVLATIDAMTNWCDSEDYGSVMECFSRWYYEAEYTPDNEVFDCGNTCSTAICNYKSLGMSPDECGLADEYSNGNGGLMRILPALFYVHLKYGEKWVENDKAIEIIEKLTALTHAHKRSAIASVMYLAIAEEILKGEEKHNAVHKGLSAARAFYSGNEINHKELTYFDRISNTEFCEITQDEIMSDGYVINTLESAIWSFLNTSNYKECVFTAINLGDDTDTTAAVAGGIAGLYYGFKSIPRSWLKWLAKRMHIKYLCDRFGESLKIHQSEMDRTQAGLLFLHISNYGHVPNVVFRESGFEMTEEKRELYFGDSYPEWILRLCSESDSSCDDD